MAVVHDREVLAAVLRWHTLHTRRLEIGAQMARLQKAEREHYRAGRSVFDRPRGPTTSDVGPFLTTAKQLELRALRALAKVCTSMRATQQQATDASVVDMPMRLTTTISTPGTAFIATDQNTLIHHRRYTP